jgi:hypothetical protein
MVAFILSHFISKIFIQNHRSSVFRLDIGVFEVFVFCLSTQPNNNTFALYITMNNYSEISAGRKTAVRRSSERPPLTLSEAFGTIHFSHKQKCLGLLIIVIGSLAIVKTSSIIASFF